jgi:hypothetical protein
MTNEPWQRDRENGWFAFILSMTITFMVVCTIFPKPQRLTCCMGGPTQDARATVKKYVYEAYPQWAVHKLVACPRSLQELDPFMNNAQPRDPWGHRYRMYCNRSDPKSVRLVVVSDGEDGESHTDDDMSSSQ